MMTAPERCPNETILMGMPLSARSITSGASIYAAWMRPDMSDSLTSGQPLYLLNWYSNRGAAPGVLSFWTPLATQATGNVRLQVTGRAPTTSSLAFFAEHPRRPAGTAAARPWRTRRRDKRYASIRALWATAV